jgi:hypothetical protein
MRFSDPTFGKILAIFGATFPAPVTAIQLASGTGLITSAPIDS